MRDFAGDTGTGGFAAITNLTNKNGRQGRPSMNKLRLGAKSLFDHTVRGVPLA
jgi:hypothetical protein